MNRRSLHIVVSAILLLLGVFLASLGNPPQLVKSFLGNRIRGQLGYVYGIITQSIYILNVNDGTIRTLTNSRDTKQPRQPDWSLDGKHVVFVDGVQNNGQIYVINADGTDLKRLTNDRYNNAIPRWAQDNQRVFFLFEEGPTAFMRSIQRDSLGITQYAPLPDTSYLITLSPDQTKIVFGARTPDGDKVQVMNLDGSNGMVLTPNQYQDYEASWSPDGRRLIFASDRDKNRNIFTMNPEGTNIVQLTKGEGIDYEPLWAPDNKHIAFLRGENRQLYLMKPDGSQLIRLPEEPTTIISEFAWSPDGQAVAFTRNIGQRERSGIYILDVSCADRKDGCQSQDIARFDFDPSGDALDTPHYLTWLPQ